MNRLVAGLVGGAASLGMLVASSPPSAAVPAPVVNPAQVAPAIVSPAWGTAHWHYNAKPIGSFKYSIGGVTIKVPTGCFLSMSMFYNHKTAGIGTVRGGTDCIGPMAVYPRWYCNTKFSVSLYDTSTRRYHKWVSKINNSCRTFIGPVTMPYSYRGKYGKVCVRFYVNGVRRGTTCIGVTK